MAKARARGLRHLDPERLRVKLNVLRDELRSTIADRQAVIEATETLDSRTVEKFLDGKIDATTETLLTIYHAAGSPPMYHTDLWRALVFWDTQASNEKLWAISRFTDLPGDLRDTLDAQIDEMLASVRRDHERYGDAVRLYIDCLMDVASRVEGQRIPYPMGVQRAREDARATALDEFPDLAAPLEHVLKAFAATDTQVTPVVYMLARPGTARAKANKLLKYLVDRAFRV